MKMHRKQVRRHLYFRRVATVHFVSYDASYDTKMHCRVATRQNYKSRLTLASSNIPMEGALIIVTLIPLTFANQKFLFPNFCQESPNFLPLSEKQKKRGKFS